MKCFLILCSASCKTEIIFDVVDISFDNSPDFVCIIPFFGSANRSGISTQILFRVSNTSCSHLKVLFEAGDFGSVRDFRKTAEFAEWFLVSEKSQEKLVCRDRENTLDDQSPQESL